MLSLFDNLLSFLILYSVYHSKMRSNRLLMRSLIHSIVIPHMHIELITGRFRQLKRNISIQNNIDGYYSRLLLTYVKLPD